MFRVRDDVIVVANDLPDTNYSRSIGTFRIYTHYVEVVRFHHVKGIASSDSSIVRPSSRESSSSSNRLSNLSHPSRAHEDLW